MIALVEFDGAIKKNVYEKLKGIYDFGEVTDRVYKGYNDELLSMPKDEYFKDEVEKIEDDKGYYYVLKSDHNKRISSYEMHERVEGDWVGITNTKHVADLKELYTACRKAQVKILEVARLD